MEPNQSRLKNVWSSAVKEGSRFAREVVASFTSSRHMAELSTIASALGTNCLVNGTPKGAVPVNAFWVVLTAGLAALRDRHRAEGPLHTLRETYSENYLPLVTAVSSVLGTFSATHHDPKHALLDFGMAAAAQIPRATREIRGAFRRHREQRAAALCDPARREYFHDDGGPFFL